MTRPSLHIVTTVGQSIYTLLAGQPRRLAGRFDLTLVASPDEILQAAGDREGVRTRAVVMTRRITPLADLRALWSLYRWFRTERPDIVQSYTPKGGLLAMAAARLAKVPVRVHGIVGMPLMVTGGWRARVLATTEWFTYVMSTHLLCNSTGLRSWIEDHLSPTRPIGMVANGSINGVDLTHFTPASLTDREGRRRDLGVGTDTVVYAFIGRLVRDKGLPELLTAFDALRQTERNVLLLVVGDEEPDRDPLPAETRGRLRAGAGVVHFGWQDDIRPVLAAADVCILPSHREGLPNTLLEAAACGLPAVATDINGCNEVIEHGRTGILVPVGDVSALCNGLVGMLDPKLRLAMGRAARDGVANRYDHADFCEALETYYLAALNSARAGDSH